jgi:carboxynorspermidine decarboxylase
VKNISDIPSPCFVLEEDRLIQNLNLIERVRNEVDIDIILAFKGFAMWSAFSLLKDKIDGTTASSLNEVLLSQEKLNLKPHTYCVAYLPEEFDEIISNSSHITFNSMAQYNTYKDRVPKDVSIGLRVNPEWSDVLTDLYNPSSPDSRLGIRAEELKELPPKVEGLHFHVLCESDSNALEQVLKNFVSLYGHLLEQVKWVNMGGGHLMTRKGYNIEHLVALIKKFKDDHDVEVILEPGSAFVWDAGYLKTKILDIVNNGGIRTAIIDASFTCHMPDCLEMPYRPVIKGAFSEKKEGMPSYRLGGISCLAGDYLDEYWFEKELAVGDSIIFEDMIHYTMVKTTMFNGVNHPSIAIIRSNGNFELIREFAYKDYKGRLS